MTSSDVEIAFNLALRRGVCYSCIHPELKNRCDAGTYTRPLFSSTQALSMGYMRHLSGLP